MFIFDFEKWFKLYFKSICQQTKYFWKLFSLSHLLLCATNLSQCMKDLLMDQFVIIPDVHEAVLVFELSSYYTWAAMYSEFHRFGQV